MKIAFCFLTYKNILHPAIWAPYFENNNVYIHPKQRNYINNEHNCYVIPTIIDTVWGERSIVDATILLLEQAFIDNDNKWFILCSEDSCPLKSYTDFYNFFEKQSLSIFNVMDSNKNKTSQWWALSRTDVGLLLENKQSFSKIFDDISKKYRKQAVDELFFLNALKQIKSDYTFTNGCVHYVKWFSEWVSKHPTAFNRLLEEDINNINNQSCWFIRKTFPTFQSELIDKKPNCIIMCIGSESSDNYDQFLDFFSERSNIFLLVMDPTKLVEQQLLKQKCEQAFYVVWNMADKAIPILYNKFTQKYDNVYILKEKFNYSNINYPTEVTNSIYFLKSYAEIYSPTTVANPTPSMKGPAPPAMKGPATVTQVSRPQTKITSLHEYNKNYKIAFLFLVIEDINYPEIWADYFERNRQYINVYCHAKYPEKTRTEWLRRNMIRNIRNTSWGHIVDAYFSLFDAAMRDRDNTRFVVISESCLPIYSLNSFLNMLDVDDYRTSYVHFMKPSSYDISARINNQKGYERFGEFTKHYARFCLSRYHIEKLLNCNPADINFFKNMHVGDEFFLTLIQARDGQDFIKHATITYDNWEDVNKEANSLKNRIDKIKRDYEHLSKHEYENAKREVERLTTHMNNLRKNPKTYYEVSQYDIDRAFNSGAFFWRKFAPRIRDIYRYYNRNGELINHHRESQRRHEPYKNVSNSRHYGGKRRKTIKRLRKHKCKTKKYRKTISKKQRHRLRE